MARVVAEFVAGHEAEHVAWARKMTEAAPDHPGGWRWLATGYALVGRLEESRAAVRRLLDLLPHYNLGLVESAATGVQPADLDRLIDSLREAGLPEG